MTLRSHQHVCCCTCFRTIPREDSQQLHIYIKVYVSYLDNGTMGFGGDWFILVVINYSSDVDMQTHRSTWLCSELTLSVKARNTLSYHKRRVWYDISQVWVMTYDMTAHRCVSGLECDMLYTTYWGIGRGILCIDVETQVLYWDTTRVMRYVRWPGWAPRAAEIDCWSLELAWHTLHY